MGPAKRIIVTALVATMCFTTWSCSGGRTRVAQAGEYDLVLTNGMVIDPESGLEAVRDVAIRDDKIVAISSTPLIGKRVIDAGGRIVAPGFIDLHSHAHNAQFGGRVEAFDGVTTAIEGEMGALPIATAYEKAKQEGRAINYGFTASWLQARMAVMANVQVDGTLEGVQSGLGKPGWANVEASPEQAQQILAKLDEGLSEGALGIGFLLGYAPGAKREESHQLSLLAARRDVPIFVHTRSTVDTATSLQEVFDEAAATGAQWHICHAPLENRPALQAKLVAARTAGARITAETLTSVGSGSTIVSAEFLRPAALQKRGIPASHIVYYGKRVESYEELARIQSSDPGAYISTGTSNPDDTDVGLRNQLAESLKMPDWTIGTDSMPWTDFSGHTVPAGTWPVPAQAWAHPRSAATYSRLIEKYVVEWNLVKLMDVLRGASLNPARMLERSVPGMRNKGRIKVGADADIIVFDPAKVRVTATMLKPASLSTGMDYVIVGGSVLIDQGSLNPAILPGRPVRREAAGR